jgi:hypothetical protein
MFTIRDGREHFYAWDLDRQIIVADPSITEVHFCNRTDDCSLVVEVKEENGIRVANVPNIILQSSFDIRVFGYDGKATLHEKTFKVKSRTRPADYVYTETEILSVEKLVQNVEQLEEDLRNNIDERLINIAQEIILVLDADKVKKNFAPATKEQINFIETALADPARSIHVLLEGDNTFCYINATGGGRYEIYPYQSPATMTYDRGTYNTFRIDFQKDTLGNWSVQKHQYEVLIASVSYVDNAIANIKLPEGGDVDLSNYYTKEETTQAIQDALNAIGIAEGGAY